MNQKHVINFLLLLFFLFIIPCNYSIADGQRRVVDNDFPNQGVAAELYLKKGSKGKENLVAYSNSDGDVNPDFDCNELHILKVLPDANSGYFRFERHCASTGNLIKLRRVKSFVNLLVNAIMNLDSKNFGSAALALREASGFALYANLPLRVVTSLSNSSVLATAKAIGAPEKIIVGQFGAILPEEVKGNLTSFQNESQIKAGVNTGQPTYATVRALTNVKPWTLMTKVENPDKNTQKLLESIKDESSIEMVVDSLSKDQNTFVFGSKYFDNIATDQKFKNNTE